jgi:8-oxo-dGTP pyrophosphatase MutT (NUDIX family)
MASLSRRGSAPLLSAGVVVVRRLNGAWRLLMLRAYRNWDFPKGLLEPGEAALDAARREVAEESGLRDLRFAWGEHYIETAPYARNKVARYYLAEAPTGDPTLPIQPDLGRPEHHEARWVTVDEALALAPPRLHPVVRWAQLALDATP